jgi:hypothetical protein
MAPVTIYGLFGMIFEIESARKCGAAPKRCAVPTRCEGGR